MTKQIKPFKNLSSKLQRFDLNKLFISIMQNRGLQTFIGDLQRDRLEFSGTDIDGKKIQTDEARIGNTTEGAYAKQTERLKTIGKTRKNGKLVNSNKRPTDHVTLNQEGDFHKTIVGKLIGNEMEVFKDWLSPNEDIRNNFELSDTDRFFGFTDFDKQEILFYIKRNNLLEIELKKLLK